MFRKYYVNDNEDPEGYHEVHAQNCSRLLQADSVTCLGYFSNCTEAMVRAVQLYPLSDGCFYCSPECHHH